ncbi:MAG: hypothetical protein H7Y59_07390 [Anaerolineales bacterium]|nr:hypothetical protein [Anaerolineales bacterium]
MKHLKTILFSVLLLVASLACSAVSNLMATPTPAPTVTPASTATPVPTSTPLPLPTSDVVLFEDSEFTNSCNTDSTADVERSVVNGQFNMLINTAQYVGWSECTKVEFSDVIVEADAIQVAGSKDSIYGILFRYGLDDDEFYVFAVSGDGFYILAIDGAEHTEPEIIVDWTESSAIKQDQQTNHLKVVAIGSNIQYYVNDQLLGEAQDFRLTKGTVGFFVGSIEEGGIQVAFDNLKISQP